MLTGLFGWITVELPVYVVSGAFQCELARYSAKVSACLSEFTISPWLSLSAMLLPLYGCLSLLIQAHLSLAEIACAEL